MNRFNKILLILVCFIATLIADNNIISLFKDKTRNIGKSTPINIMIYVKNPSTVCSLTITNMTNPYGQDITQTKLLPVELLPGRYLNASVDDIAKGKYEFEYRWNMNGTFVDSSLRSIYILAYHNSANSIYKKVNLGFLLIPPKVCR